MSRFGDLIAGKNAPAPAPVVEEAPAPVVEEAPSPVVEEAPAPVVEEAPAPVAKKKREDRREEVEQEWKEATNS